MCEEVREGQRCDTDALKGQVEDSWLSARVFKLSPIRALELRSCANQTPALRSNFAFHLGKLLPYKHNDRESSGDSDSVLFFGGTVFVQN